MSDAFRGVISRISCALTAMLVVVGCQSEYRSDSKKIVTAYTAGQFPEAAKLAADAAIDRNSDHRDKIVLCFDAGSTAATAGDTTGSIKWFEEAYEGVRPYLDAKADASASEALITTAVNQSMSLYRGTTCDRIWLDTMQTMNMLVSGKIDEARIELRRAYEWQRDAAQRYGSEILAAQDAATKSGESKTASASGSVSGDPHFSNLDSMTGYASFVNPYTTWLFGVFLLSCGEGQADFDEARSEFLRVGALLGEAAQIQIASAVVAAEARQRGESLSPTTWVVLLDGLAAHKEEFRLDIPIPVGNVNYVSAAFPYLVETPSPRGACTAEAQGISAPMFEAANMDSMVGADFKARLPLIITQELISSATKAAATYAARASAGSDNTAAALFQIAGIVYQATSTSADTRSWHTMPKRILVAQIATPSDGTVRIVSGSGTVAEAKVDPGATSIVFVTAPGIAAATRVAKLTKYSTIIPPPVTIN